jgi:hypothetical protein
MQGCRQFSKPQNGWQIAVQQWCIEQEMPREDLLE